MTRGKLLLDLIVILCFLVCIYFQLRITQDQQKIEQLLKTPNPCTYTI